MWIPDHQTHISFIFYSQNLLFTFADSESTVLMQSQGVEQSTEYKYWAQAAITKDRTPTSS